VIGVVFANTQKIILLSPNKGFDPFDTLPTQDEAKLKMHNRCGCGLYTLTDIDNAFDPLVVSLHGEMPQSSIASHTLCVSLKCCFEISR
jgi:hypothetical protein